jgi:hypothetical protein
MWREFFATPFSGHCLNMGSVEELQVKPDSERHRGTALAPLDYFDRGFGAGPSLASWW